MTKSILIALGGNALSPKEEAGTIYQQFAHTRESVDNIMHFVQLGYNICLTHGNGPQVGDELYRMELTHETIPPLPLGVCVAGTQGSIGYMVQQSLQNVLKEKKIDREVVTLITQTIVDKNDPSINDPQKFIFKHGKKQLLPNGLIILSSYHPSPRNVNTKLISTTMMVNLFKKAKKLANF